MGETLSQNRDPRLNQNENHEEAQATLREIGRDELGVILKAHQQWLDSDGKDGKKADLQRVDLRKADLVKANLQGALLIEANFQNVHLIDANLSDAYLSNANLRGAILTRVNLRGARLTRNANLQDAYLWEADMQGADLEGANLKNVYLANAKLNGANLTRANLEQADLTEVSGLSEAILHNTNLDDASGLLGSEFARADVTGATLPKDIREFKGLGVIEEISKNARKVFFAMLLACVYSWLTIATTNDAHLLTNSASSRLPIIGTEIPIAGFYWAAPIILIVLYAYFHLYLQHLWEGLSGLPAIFPDGKRLDQRAYPWLLSGLVRRYFSLLQGNRPLVAKLEEVVSILLAWWCVPVTLVGLWLRYLPRHDWFGTMLHILLLVVSIGIGAWFLKLTRRALRGGALVILAQRKILGSIKSYIRGTALGVLGTFLFFVSLHGMNIGPTYNLGVFNLISFTGYRPYAELSEADVSTKPANWTDIEEQVDLVKGARLRGANLRYASGYGVFLIKADLRHADLSFGEFQSTDLRKANLEYADLAWADLMFANLRGTNLNQADLQWADLSWAVGLTTESVKKARNWVFAVYDGEFARELGLPIGPEDGRWDKRWDQDFRGYDFRGVNLMGANLQGANLSEANLENVFLQEAILVNANLKQANLTNAHLQASKLKGADLEGASLVDASFAFATLENANLRDADLSGAYLRTCKGLTQEQLVSACGNEKTDLPQGLFVKPCKKGGTDK